MGAFHFYIQKKMKTQKIQEQIKKKEEEIAKLKSQLIRLNIKSSKYIYISQIDKEVEIEVHDKGKSWNELKQIYGEEFESLLLTKEECEKILKNKEVSQILKMDGSSSKDDFFIQQFNEENKKKGYVADFYSDGVGSYFYSGRGSGVADSCRGVRFCRKKISKGKKI